MTSLSVQINGTSILHDVSVDIAPGEVVAVTGESRSGKSMTALGVMGLLLRGAVATGAVMLDGRDVLQAAEAELRAMRGNDAAMIFQEPMTALNPVQTIGDQVAETVLVYRVAGKAEVKRWAAAILERVGLPNDQFPPSRYPHELSGGQRQRVVIAMAIALRPKLLIADEPTSALDVTTQATILTMLRDLVAEFGMVVLIITHDLAVVVNMADQIVVMQRGRVVK